MRESRGEKIAERIGRAEVRKDSVCWDKEFGFYPTVMTFEQGTNRLRLRFSKIILDIVLSESTACFSIQFIPGPGWGSESTSRPRFNLQ